MAIYVVIFMGSQTAGALTWGSSPTGSDSDLPS